ncbi:hypothetical protein [Ancylomarina longa]|uniref:Uncharacterized protein n=1 Tax=Ancylomarina longa TaxID=2487017 RepID=A0A434AT91_9BACT|nr:hypothetical protein [Ancylomarina longa]RUT77643.1 hypothetical protein DLK05_11980 [Ancylomarina longa]
MLRRKRNWKRLLIGGAVASGLLTILLYGFVIVDKLAQGLAIPWTVVRQNVLMVDWTCLFLASFATAILIGTKISRINGLKGLLSGFSIGSLLLIGDILLAGNIDGAVYYLFCYMLWGLCFGLIVRQRTHIIIRQF